MNNTSRPAGFLNWIAPRLTIIEIVLTAFSLLGMLLHGLQISGGSEILMIALSVQAGFYFIIIQIPIEPGLGVYSIIGYKLFSVSSSVCLIGILFSILKLSGSADMVRIGFITTSIATVLLITIAAKQWNDKFFPLFLRAAILLLATGLIMLKLISF